MLDPRYKDTLFADVDRKKVYAMLIGELKKIQQKDQCDDKNSPPVKRTKKDSSLDFMEQALDEMDERKLSTEQGGSEAIEKVCSNLLDIYESRLGDQWILE